MEKLESLLNDVVDRNQEYYTSVADLAQITAPEIMVGHEDLYAIYEQTRGIYRNITRSMGFVVRQGGRWVVFPPGKAYQWALDSALMQVQSGAISYNQAIAEAARQLAESGLKTVEYASGHVDSVDVAVRRAVMTGVNQINQKYREQSMDYLETDLVEVTAHSGARDTGTGPANHKSWQGKVYRWSEKPRSSKGCYPDFVATTGYGTGEGLGGWNCRHSYWPFIEGVSERAYTDEELANIDPPPFTFEGRTYTAYEATQKQRSLERTIRKQRRLKTAFEAAGLTEEAAAAGARLRTLNRKYREFSQAAGLPEQRERMRVQYPGKITDIKKFAPLKEYQGTIRVVGKFSANEYVVKISPPVISDVTRHFSENLMQKADRSGLTVEAAQGIINNSRIVLWQQKSNTLKFLSDSGYAVTNLQGKLVTAVPEKLRKKYLDYLEGKKNGKKS